MVVLILKARLSAAVVVAVAEISDRFPRLGALLLTLPLVSLLAFDPSRQQHRDLPAAARLARETPIVVPLGLPFFLPLAFADRIGLGFWSATAAGAALATITIGLWFAFGPRSV